MQLTFPGMGPPPPVTKVVTAFEGTSDEMHIEITVQSRRRGRRWRREIIEMRHVAPCDALQGD
jgi:hypothetical protein